MIERFLMLSLSSIILNFTESLLISENHVFLTDNKFFNERLKKTKASILANYLFEYYKRYRNIELLSVWQYLEEKMLYAKII